MAKRPFEDALSFLPPIGTNRGSRDIGHAQVGEDVVDGRAFLAEQPAELGEGLKGLMPVALTRSSTGNRTLSRRVEPSRDISSLLATPAFMGHLPCW